MKKVTSDEIMKTAIHPANPRSQTQFGNALVPATLLPVPRNRAWERSKTGLFVAILALATSTTNAASGTRDEIEQSFHVRPNGVLKIEADLGNVEITTS